MFTADRAELIALLDDVKDNPDDLTPWLVLTDWLDEHGDESDRARAEYCRLCFDKLGKKTYASDWEKGERRRALYRQYHRDWFGPLAEFAPHVQRGMLTLELGASHFLPLEGRITADRWAWVYSLSVSAATHDGFIRITQCPLLGGPSVVQLVLAYENGAPVLREALLALIDTPYLADVSLLDVRGGILRKKDRPLVRQLRARFGERLTCPW